MKAFSRALPYKGGTVGITTYGENDNPLPMGGIDSTSDSTVVIGWTTAISMK